MGERFDLALVGGEVQSGTGRFRADVGIRDGRIAAVGSLDLSDAQEVVDITGLWVWPGVIDSQVHFREPGLVHKEDLATGSMAAVLGGGEHGEPGRHSEPRPATGFAGHRRGLYGQ